MSNDVLFCEQLIPADDARRLLHLLEAQYDYSTRYGGLIQRKRTTRDFTRNSQQM